jgi:hypothetical protein
MAKAIDSFVKIFYNETYVLSSYATRLVRGPAPLRDKLHKHSEIKEKNKVNFEEKNKVNFVKATKTKFN